MIKHNFNSQRGVALVISLIILVSLTMLGLTSLQRTTTDLSMAGNQREIGLMFQSAEAGLVAAENTVRQSNSNGDFNNPSVGFYEVLADNPSYSSPDYFLESNWENQSTAAASSYKTKFGVVAEPRYMIEYLGDRAENPLALINIDGYGQQQTGKIVSIYRSTARGVGLTGNSSRFVQSYFGKEIKP